MLRETVDFATFEEAFIKHPNGYFPVYSGLEEAHEGGVYLKVMQIDMICEWRMTDGKVKFVAVTFDTREQFDKIIEYLKGAATLLKKTILKRISDIPTEYNDIRE